MNATAKGRSLLVLALASMVAMPAALAVTVTFSVAGANTAAIQPTVDSFRSSLGSLNPNTVGSVGSGRREINWDGVPDSLAAPNNLPGNFFNVNSPRGVVINTPGTGLMVSANAGLAPVEFGNINPSYPGLFAPFSAQRLFTPLGSNITDVSFFVPGTATAALTNGFGSVFSNVSLSLATSLQFFDAFNASLGTFYVPSIAGTETLSFLGVKFDDAIVARVRITSGTQILAAGNTASNLVVMDDWIYGEPIAAAGAATPDEGSTALLLGLALAIMASVRRVGLVACTNPARFFQRNR
ncbi:MAG: VPDSG-CTERM sorting domain-containing protein [Opitutaceae bacterium]